MRPHGEGCGDAERTRRSDQGTNDDSRRTRGVAPSREEAQDEGGSQGGGAGAEERPLDDLVAPSARFGGCIEHGSAGDIPTDAAYLVAEVSPGRDGRDARRSGD